MPAVPASYPAVRHRQSVQTRLAYYTGLRTNAAQTSALRESDRLRMEQGAVMCTPDLCCFRSTERKKKVVPQSRYLCGRRLNNVNSAQEPGAFSKKNEYISD